MVTQLAIRQGYRFYAAVLVIWSGWTAVWSATPVEMASTTIAYGWYGVALGGALVAASLYATRTSVFEGAARDVDRFLDHSLSGWPLGAYAGLLVVWSAVFAGWTTGALAVSRTVVGYGWLAIAGYGAVLTIGLVSLHRETVMSAINLRTVDRDRV